VFLCVVCLLVAKMQTFVCSGNSGEKIKEIKSQMVAQKMMVESEMLRGGERGENHTDRVYNSNPMKYKRKDSKAENHKRMSSVCV